MVTYHKAALSTCHSIGHRSPRKTPSQEKNKSSYSTQEGTHTFLINMYPPRRIKHRRRISSMKETAIIRENRYNSENRGAFKKNPLVFSKRFESILYPKIKSNYSETGTQDK